MNRTLQTPALMLFALVLAGCSLAPKYERPEVAVPDTWRHANDVAGPWKPAQPSEHVERGEWWRMFDDPQLNALQREALSANQDLQAAAARLRQSRALLGNARADRFPTVEAGFGPTRQRPSPASQGLAADADTDAATLWRAQAGLRYEIDLFGRVESTVNAATASNQRDEALYRSLMLALQADVAQTWLTIRELDAELALYANAVDLRTEALHLMERRFEEGFTSELDVARSRTELATAQSESLAVARRRTLAEHALALLLGKAPAEFKLGPDPLMRVDVRVPAGVPSALLERRPDIAAAERAMAAANARIGAARAAFFPSLVLTGAAGYESASLGDLLDWSSRAFVLGPVAGTIASLPIFDGGRRQANLDRSRAEWEEEVANYRQTVLTAFREVEDHLASLDLLGRQTTAQNDAVTAARRAAALSRIQYREGDIGYLDVIETERNVLLQQRIAVQIDAERARSVVGLIRATGGSWDAPETTDRKTVALAATPGK